MICDNCTRSIDAESRFCPHCGSPQHTTGTNGHKSSTRDSQVETRIASRSLKTEGEKAIWPITAAGVILLVLLVVGAFGGTGESQKTSETPAADPMTASVVDSAAKESPVVAPKDPEPVDPWSYFTDEDKVRGGTSYFAATPSTNSVFQSAPYDAHTTMTMTVRKTPSSGTDVVLTISSGQLMCPSYEGCSGTVRFDKGRAQHISFSGPADNSSDTIFVNGAKSFISKLKRSKKVIIEKTLYEAGQPQFEFDVQGLKWDH